MVLRQHCWNLVCCPPGFAQAQAVALRTERRLLMMRVGWTAAGQVERVSEGITDMACNQQESWRGFARSNFCTLRGSIRITVVKAATRPVELTVVKAATRPVELWSFETEQELAPWLDEALGVVPYSNDAREPPRDDQTSLRDAQLFKPVPHWRVQERQVYRHITRSDLYYVDNSPSGRSAYLEVFNKRYKHRGEADLEGRLRPGTCVKTRKLNQ